MGAPVPRVPMLPTPVCYTNLILHVVEYMCLNLQKVLGVHAFTNVFTEVHVPKELL